MTGQVTAAGVSTAVAADADDELSLGAEGLLLHFSLS